MAIKFNEYWNIIPDRVDEYIEFLRLHRIPTMNRLGMNIVAMWSSLIGASPQIISVGVSEDLECCERVLKSKEYYQLTAQLLHYVTDYRSKVLIATPRFSHLPRGTEKGPVKLSQYWDIIPGKEEDYDLFIREEHFSAMNDLGIEVIGEWKVLVGESPNIFYESRANDERQLLHALTSQKFRHLKYELLQLVTNYSSRILVYHAQKVRTRGSVDYEFFLV